MKQNLMCVCMLLIAALSSPIAKADTIDMTPYAINFTGSPTFPTAASFTYDPDTATFSSFVITWDGLLFDLTSSANFPTLSATPPPCIGSLTGGAATYALLSGACSPAPGDFTTAWGAHLQPDPIFEFATFDATSWIRVYGFNTPQYGNDAGGGDWTITPSSGTAPEPDTLLMFGSGIMGLASLLRRKVNL